VNPNPLEFALGTDDTSTVLWRYTIVYFLAASTIIPFLTVIGYLVSVMEHAMNGGGSAPEFTGYIEFLKDGVEPAAALAVLLTAPFLVLSLAFNLSSALGIIISLPLVAIVYYLSPAVLAEYSRQHNLREMDVSAFATALFSQEYFLAFFAGVGVYIGSTILGLLITLTVIGGILLPGFVLLGFVAASYCWAIGYQRGIAEDVE
jgi:uncharacterized membrane protein